MNEKEYFKAYDAFVEAYALRFNLSEKEKIDFATYLSEVLEEISEG